MNQLAKLEHLKFIISNIKEENINLMVWIGNTPCGTYGCVGGHASLDADFKKQGLGLKYGLPYYSGYIGYSALAAFFELDRKTTRYIFNPFAYEVFALDGVKAEIIDHISNVITELSELRKIKR